MKNTYRPNFNTQFPGLTTIFAVTALAIVPLRPALADASSKTDKQAQSSHIVVIAQQDQTTRYVSPTPSDTTDESTNPQHPDVNNDPVLDHKITESIKKAVDHKINAVLKKLNLLFAFQELQILAAGLETREVVTDAARDEILKHLTNLKELEDYENVPGFRSSLRRIIDSFTSSYQVAAVDEIDDLYRAEINRIPDVPTWMTNHFGRVLVTSSDLRDKSSKRWERLQHYSDIAKQNRNPEISLLWDILTQFVASNEERSISVSELVARLEHFSEQDRQAFFEALDQESSTAPGEPPDLRRLAQVATKLLDTYQVEFTQFGYQPNG